MTVFGDRLAKTLAEKDMRQSDLARLTGINRAIISEYIKGKYVPKQKNTYKIATALNVKPSYLMGAEPKEEYPITDPRNPKYLPDEIITDLPERLESIPVLGDVAAGTPIYAEENVEGYVSTLDISDPEHCFALTAIGDSMLPNIKEGDRVICRKQSDVLDGQIACVLVDTGATIKHVYHTPEGLKLVADNPEVYAPKIYSPQEIEDKPVRILGLVIQAVKKFAH